MGTTLMSETRTMVNQAIQDALKTVLPDPDTTINGDTDLAADMGLDSLQVIDMAMEIEDQLDISIPVDLLADVRTVDDLSTRIVKLIAEQTS